MTLTHARRGTDALWLGAVLLFSGTACDAVAPPVVTGMPPGVPAQVSRGEAHPAPTSVDDSSAPDRAIRACELSRTTSTSPQAASEISAGLAALDAGDLAGGERRFSQALRLDAQAASAVYHLAWIAERRGAGDEALARYRQALTIDAGFLPAIEATVLAKLRAGDVRGASTFLDPIVESHPTSGSLQSLRARVLGVRGRWSEALETLNAALSCDGTSIEALTAVARCALALGDLQRADDALAVIAEQEVSRPNDPRFAESHVLRGTRTRMRPGRSRAAVEEFERAVRLRPDYADARMELGVSLLAAGDYDAAVTHLRVAAMVVPWSWQVGLAHADALRSARRFDDSLREIERVRSIGANQPEIGYSLALVHLERSACLRTGDVAAIPDCTLALEGLVAYRNAIGTQLAPGDVTERYVTMLQRIVPRLRAAANARDTP